MTEESSRIKEMLESEGEMRVRLQEILDVTFFSNDIDEVRRQLEGYYVHHGDLHRAMSALEMKISLNTIFKIPGIDHEELIAEMSALIDVHVAVEWFELNVLDHYHRLRGDGDDRIDLSADDAKGER